MITISMHLHETIPHLLFNEVEGDHQPAYVVTIYSAEADCEIDLYFHDKHLYSEFIAALKNETWRR
jgi:hypothetical protein